VPTDPGLLADYFTFTDFAHFVTAYLSVVDLVRDPQDIWPLTHDIGVDLAAQNVRYVELTHTPYSSVTRGIAAEAYCEAVEDARHAVEAEHDIAMRWCFDIPGESGIPRPSGRHSGSWARSESAMASPRFATRCSSSIWRRTRSRSRSVPRRTCAPAPSHRSHARPGVRRGR
jgi:Adenosine deaminase